MVPTQFKESNMVFVAEDCSDLPAYKDGREVISCWKGTLLDRVRFLVSGVMWFGVKGTRQPPIWLSTERPFVKQEEIGL